MSSPIETELEWAIENINSAKSHLYEINLEVDIAEVIERLNTVKKSLQEELNEINGGENGE